MAASESAEARSNEIIRGLSAEAASLDQKVRDYAEELASRPRGGCALTERDLERLLPIGASLQPVTLPSPGAAGDLYRTVPAPALRKGDDARLKLAETRAALAKANGRISGGCRWYDGVRRHYGSSLTAFDCDTPPVD